MRILFAAIAYKPAYKMGGPVLSVSSTAETLVRKGHHVTVFASNTNMNEELDVPVDQPVDVDGVEVWYFRPREYLKQGLPFIPYLSQSLGFMYSPKMKAKLEQLVPSLDIVHTQSPFIYPTLAAGRAAARFSKPLFYQQRGSFGRNHLGRRALKKRLYMAAFERGILRSATTLVALAQAEVDSYKALGLTNHIEIVPNGIDVARYRVKPEEPIEEKLGLPKDATMVLFMGRLNPTKGVSKLLKAFLAVRNRLPEAALVIAGPDEVGLEADLRNIAAAAGAGDRVKFVGMATGDFKLDLLARADLFVLPSQDEGFSMAVLEALSSSTAVLLSPGCNFPEVETAGAGRVRPDDVDSLEQALLDLIPHKSLMSKMGERGRELVLRDYTWDRVTDKLIDVYGEGLERHRSRLMA